MIAPGTILGPYHVLSEFRSGGMANLFLGTRNGSGGFEGYRVIKAVKSHLAGHENFVEMFLDEARIATRIDHPCVVRIEELGEHEGTYFLVMEHVLGMSLSELLAALAESGQRMQTAMTLRVLQSVCAGLHAAHDTTDERGAPLNVIHRDISPQNVLLGVGGAVKLIDFGIAKARDRLHVTTVGSGLKGKLRYMAPEQLMRADIDRRADIYSLGVMAWEMLTMRRLFQGKSDVEVMQRIRQGNHSPPGAFVALPHAVDEVIMGALSLDPADRPATAEAFGAQLHAAMPSSASVHEEDISALLHTVHGALLRERAEAVGLALGAPSTMAMTELLDDDFADASTLPSQSFAPRFSASDVVYSEPEYAAYEEEGTVPFASLYDGLEESEAARLRSAGGNGEPPAIEGPRDPAAPWTPDASARSRFDAEQPTRFYRADSSMNLSTLVGVAVLGLVAGAIFVLALLFFFS